MKDMREHYHGPWMLPRFIIDETSQEGDVLRRTGDQLSTLFSSITRSGSTVPTVHIQSKQSTVPKALDNWDGCYYNDSQDEVSLQISRQQNKDFLRGSSNSPARAISPEMNKLTFHIPSHSSLLLSDCDSTDKFRNNVRWLSQEYDRSRIFDFILLDPPWENRSAKRRAAYETNSVQTLIDNMDLSSYLQLSGFVGIWVTNRSAHRQLVLGPGGIFESLNVSLVEEWIWLKTTTRGEPVTQLDGIWRKPYEVFLLGHAPESRLQTTQAPNKVVRRIIVGVPDFHSRKPCIKTLIEPFLPEEYQALELFARYLVQGWTSWGNEVLKYNYEGSYEVDGESI
jgi:N6-adenosine-specific RNA methylase IME4